MKELTKHNELKKMHGREVIVEYKDKLVEGVLSVNSRGWVYFCFEDIYTRPTSLCKARFGYNADRLISHSSRSSRYENNDRSLTKHVYIREVRIEKEKYRQDRLDALEEEILSLRREIEYDKDEEIRKLKENIIKQNTKMYLETDDKKTKLKLRYQGVTLIQLNDEGLTTYRKTEEAIILFQEWIDKGCELKFCNELWKGKQYYIAKTKNGANIRLYSQSSDSNYPQAIFEIKEGYGCKNCTDSNIMRMPFNKRAVVHY